MVIITTMFCCGKVYCAEMREQKMHRLGFLEHGEYVDRRAVAKRCSLVERRPWSGTSLIDNHWETVEICCSSYFLFAGCKRCC